MNDANADIEINIEADLASALVTNSTPNAPVEQREAIAQIIRDEAQRHQGFAFPPALVARLADAILAVRLDEAAIRKDEREKCAKTADAACDNSDKASNPYDGGSGSLGYEAACDDIASAIRNGGKQP